MLFQELFSIVSGKNGLRIKSWYYLRQLHRDNAKWIDERNIFIFLEVHGFLSGRRPPDQGYMFEKLHSERVKTW